MYPKNGIGSRASTDDEALTAAREALQAPRYFNTAAMYTASPSLVPPQSVKYDPDVKIEYWTCAKFKGPFQVTAICRYDGNRYICASQPTLHDARRLAKRIELDKKPKRMPRVKSKSRNVMLSRREAYLERQRLVAERQKLRRVPSPAREGM